MRRRRRRHRRRARARPPHDHGRPVRRPRPPPPDRRPPSPRGRPPRWRCGSSGARRWSRSGGPSPGWPASVERRSRRCSPGPRGRSRRPASARPFRQDTRFLGLSINAEGTARVDLSRDFESGGGSLGLTLRLAQVTCTLDDFPTVKGVRFALAGELVSVFSGNGIVLDKPVTCDSYRQYLAQPGAQPAFAGIWPFATKAELDAYGAGSDRTYRDPVATARDFAVKYIGHGQPGRLPTPDHGPGHGGGAHGPPLRRGPRAVAEPTGLLRRDRPPARGPGRDRALDRRRGGLPEHHRHRAEAAGEDRPRPCGSPARPTPSRAR